jgi:hypothetical protein
MVNLDDVRQRHDPNHERYLLMLHPLRDTLAVPALV